MKEVVRTKGKEHNIYDRTFKEMFQISDRMVIRFINSLFDENLLETEDLSLKQMSPEFVSNDRSIQMDMLLELKGNHTKYQIEAQTYADEMSIRMFEYGSKSAMRDKYVSLADEHHIYLPFPRQAVIYLKSNKNTPDNLKITVIFPDNQEKTYEIKTIKLQEMTQ